MRSVPSSAFRIATHDAATLSTAIAPRRGAALPQLLDSDAPEFAASDWRGVSFTSAVPSRFTASDDVVLTGRVTARDGIDFDRIVLSLWNEGAADAITFAGGITRGGDFTVPIHFAAGQRGRYIMSVYLFWPDSGPQRPRASLTSIGVE